jgi:hypothetical protein
MAELQTNFNVAPFYDDYDEDKMYYRILFRPSTAVQARELTQLQTMMQKQISRFGSSIYKDGSIVEGCNFTQYPFLSQVKFKDSNTATLDFKLLTKEVADADGTASHLSDSYLLVSNTTGLRAAVFEAFSGAEAAVDRGSNNTNRAYLIYINTGRSDYTTGGTLEGSGTAVYTFNPAGEKINVYSPSQDRSGSLNSNYYVGDIYVLPSNNTVNALGQGYGLHVGEGIIYQKGFFLKSTAKNFIIKEHNSNAVGIKVGFNTKEYIVEPTEDISLYDNSIGSPNYNAPGAYRLKLVPELISYDTNDATVTIPKDFVPVVDFSGGTGAPVTINQDPLLSKLGDIIAKRTFEESGNYVVKPFQVNVEASSNSQTMYYTVSPGIAYVDGYRVELLAPRKIEVNRGISSNSLINERATVNFGNYLKVADFTGIIDTGSISSVGLYSANQYALSRNMATSSTSSPAGTLVGNVTIRAVKHYTGTKGTAEAVYYLYINDVKMISGYSFQDAKSIYVNGTYGKAFADIIPDPTAGYNILYQTDSTSKSLIFNTGAQGTKRLLSSTGANNTNYIFRTTTDAITAVRSSTFFISDFSTTGSDEFNYGATSGLSDSASLGIDVFFNTDVVANLYNSAAGSRSAGSIAGTSNTTHSNVSCAAITSATGSFVYLPPGLSPAVDGSGRFVTPYTTTKMTVDAGITPRVGEAVRANYTVGTTPTTSYHTIARIDSANQISVTPPLGAAVGGTIYFNRFYRTGTPIDFNGGGNVISFSTVGGKVAAMQANVCLRDLESASYTVRAQIPQIRNQASPIEKIVCKDRWVAINVATHAAGTTGPWSLGLPDVYKIEAIHLGSNFANTNPDRKDWFTYNSGQNDNYYGLASISILPQYKNAITSASRIFARVSHFTPNVTAIKATFFSVDSYPIDDANTANTYAIQTAQIPVYKDVSGNLFDLRNHIDFRPVQANTANSDATGLWLGYTINPANTNPLYYSSASAKLAVEPDTNFTYNIEYYLPRVDSLLINKDSILTVKSSAPSFNPKPPIINDSGLKIADVYVTPYPSLTFSEAE